jgi:hypothetical protein
VRSAASLLAAAMAILLASGCGPKVDKNVGTISGQVTHHGGKPLTNALITFYAPKEGTFGSSPLDADGRYKIDTPIKAGTYHVRVTPPQVIDPADGSPPPKPIENADIPPKYREYQTSGLTATIQLGANEFNVELK